MDVSPSDLMSVWRVRAPSDLGLPMWFITYLLTYLLHGAESFL